MAGLCFSFMLGNGFTRKKVGSLTLGEKLQKIRAEYRVSLADVARETGVRKEHLEYLESGEYTKLPADVYIRGFLRSYARFLGVDPKALVRLYERERSIARNLGKEPEKATPATARRSRRFSLFVITPKMMIGAIVALGVFGITFYLYREYRIFVSEPYLVLLEPTNGQAISSDESVVVGKADRDAKLFLNTQPIFVNESGEFREQVRLQPGVNTLTVKVVNRFGKERVETVSVVASYDIPASASPLDAAAPGVPAPAKLVLSTTEKKPVSILVRSDGKDLYQGDLAVGDTKEFDCEKGCTVDSTSAVGTRASWNGGASTPLGGNAGKITGVVFPVASGKNE
jgi:transcriptional regulator with XRE-family HTH domain